MSAADEPKPAAAQVAPDPVLVAIVGELAERREMRRPVIQPADHGFAATVAKPIDRVCVHETTSLCPSHLSQASRAAAALHRPRWRWFESIPPTDVGVDVIPAGRCRRELAPQLADVYIDVPVAWPGRGSVPYARVEPVSSHDMAASTDQRVQERALAGAEPNTLSIHPCPTFTRPQLHVAGSQAVER